MAKAIKHGMVRVFAAICTRNKDIRKVPENELRSKEYRLVAQLGNDDGRIPYLVYKQARGDSREYELLGTWYTPKFLTYAEEVYQNH